MTVKQAEDFREKVLSFEKQEDAIDFLVDTLADNKRALHSIVIDVGMDEVIRAIAKELK